jgi:hypothetical protein
MRPPAKTVSERASVTMVAAPAVALIGPRSILDILNALKSAIVTAILSALAVVLEPRWSIVGYSALVIGVILAVILVEPLRRRVVAIAQRLPFRP